MKKRQIYRNNSLLGYSYRATLISTTLTAIAPLFTTLVDGLCTGNLLGAHAFNAINIVIPLVNAVSVLTLICNMGGSVLAAKQLASGNNSQADRFFTISLVSAVCVTLVSIVSIMSCFDGICRFLCSEVETLAFVRNYLGILLIYFLFVPFNTTLSNFLSVEGHPDLVSWSVIISNSVNVLLDIVFIALLGWGIAGAAWSTVISGLTNLALYLPHLLKGKSSYRFSWKAFRSGWGHMLGQILCQGFGFNVIYIVVNLFVLYCNTLISHFLGTMSLTLFGLCIQIESVTFGLTVGICIAGISHITRMQGEHDTDGIQFVINRCLKIVLLFYSALMLAMILCPRLILSCFGLNTQEMAAACTIPFACFGFFYLCFAFLAVYSTIVMQLMGHVGSKIFFIFGIGLLSAISMLAWAAAAPHKLWLGFVTGSFPMVVAALAYSYRHHLKNRSFTRFTMLDTFPVHVRFDYSMDFKLTRMEPMLHDLEVFTDVCQLPTQIIEHIKYCCMEMCDSIGEKRLRSNIKYFDLSFIETDSSFRLVLKDNGSPDNPLDYDNELAEKVKAEGYIPTERDTRLYLIHKLSDNIEYKYVFGMNITILDWEKKTAI